MEWYRIKHSIAMSFIRDPVKRGAYLKRNHILHNVSGRCMVMFRKIPLYPELISFGNNVFVASDVTFITHDVIENMLKRMMDPEGLQEYLGCIDIKDNVFLGTKSTILPNVSIGPNAIVAAGTVVNKSIGSGVFAGVPARYICSFDDFVTKRKNSYKISITRGKRGLSEETVEECWEHFYEQSIDSNLKQP